MARRSARALVAMHGARPDDARHPHRRRHAQRHGRARRVRRLDEPAAALPAIAHAAGLRRPTVDDWSEVNRRVPRLVDALPNGPVGHPTVRVFLAGGVPEVMLHLRGWACSMLECLTVTGEPLGRVLDWWEGSERRGAPARAADGDGRRRSRRRHHDPGRARRAASPARSRSRAATSRRKARSSRARRSIPASSTPTASIARRGRRASSPRERDAIAAIKSQRPDRLKPGDVLVLICRGPARRRHGGDLPDHLGAQASLAGASTSRSLTDARFSGVSTGACIGHVGPEALAGGPIGKVRDGDRIQIVVDRNRLEGTVDLVGEGDARVRSGGGRARAGRAAAAARPGARSGPRRPTRGCGRRCSKRAAGRGAAACTTWTRSPAPSSGASSPAASRPVRRARGAGRRRPSSRRLARCRLGDRDPTAACRRPGDHSRAGGRRRRTARRRFGTSA